MAWNGSGGSATPPKKAKVSGTGSSSLFRGIAALLLVLVIGGVAYLFVTQELPKVNEPTEEKVEKKAIEVVEPEIAPRVEDTQPVIVPEKPKKFWEVDASQTNGFNKAQQRKWEHMHRARTEPPKIEKKKPPYMIFEHSTENEIAFLLSAEPGMGVVGSPNYHAFKNDFAESMVQKIEILPEDDEYTRNLKTAVNETKMDLAQRIKAGEDIVEIFKESREELRRLAEYKTMMASELDNIIQDCQNDQDVDAAIEAANKMLEARGIAPLKNGAIVRAKLKYMKGRK